ncbi:MAG: ThiF family adenylyltransferase [Parabacteroides sp.]|nr:ThiF family adenylyltransferase [Parabacteroides sp.]
MKREADTSVAILPEWGEDIFPKLSWFKSDKVKQARVMVVGCGALGNEVLKNLALFGVGHLVMVDFDRVEYSNLTRSVLFRQEDATLNRPKVEAAARSLHELNPEVSLLPLQADICWQVGLGLVRRMDVVVGCLDNRMARYFLNRLCMRAGVPWVDGGINGLDGVAKVFIPGLNCYACTLEPGAMKELSRGVSCASMVRRNEMSERVATTPVIASIIGAVQAQEAMKLIHSEEMQRGELTSLCGKMFCYEGQHLTSRVVLHQGWDEECPMHEEWTPILSCDCTNRISIGEFLDRMAVLLQTDSVEIVLRNYRWVDVVEVRSSGAIYEVMRADWEVAAFVEQHPELRFVPLSAISQHEYCTIGYDFPNKQLTLQEVGIPDGDVLHIRTAFGDSYVELLLRQMDLNLLGFSEYDGSNE